MPNCPKCGSCDVHAGKKGFSVTKSIAGGVLLGPVGLLGGAIGSNKIKLTCLNCGHKFNPGDNAPTDVERIVANIQPLSTSDSDVVVENPRKQQKNSKQKVKIETLLKYSDVITNSKVEFLKALLSEGQVYVVVPAGEIDILSQLQREENPIKRIVAFKEFSE